MMRRMIFSLGVVFAGQAGPCNSGSQGRPVYVKPTNTDSDDGFGRSVALSSDRETVAVGAPRADSDATGI